MAFKIMHIGLDDTDSPRKGCTTYIAALLVEKLEKMITTFIDYPNLIRLNPNVPWKTRGNGAICLRIKFRERYQEEIIDTVVDALEANSDLCFEATEPAVVFFKKSNIPIEVKNYAKNAITGIVNPKDALKLLKKFKGEAFFYKNNRGIVGSLAAVGENLKRDYTFELLTYRTPENCGSKRRVDEATIFNMDAETKPYTFNNIDLKKKRVLITPHGPDPVLFGIRGETFSIVKKAFKMVKPLEPVERWVVFRTNQGTDAHLNHVKMLSQIQPYTSVIVRGLVYSKPKVIPRRHVIFPIEYKNEKIDCAAYEPTGSLQKVAMKLIQGDCIEVYGGVRPASKNNPKTINLEKIRILKKATKIIYHNPLCPKCGKRLKSMGKKKGFKCKKCSLKFENITKVKENINRNLKEDLYITTPRSQRHLTKPFRRYGIEKKRKFKENFLKEDWHYP
jgi:tRNA(Ile2)-agmatinylcytidine synthase